MPNSMKKGKLDKGDKNIWRLSFNWKWNTRIERLNLYVILDGVKNISVLWGPRRTIFKSLGYNDWCG